MANQLWSDENILTNFGFKVIRRYLPPSHKNRNRNRDLPKKVPEIISIRSSVDITFVWFARSVRRSQAVIHRNENVNRHVQMWNRKICVSVCTYAARETNTTFISIVSRNRSTAIAIDACNDIYCWATITTIHTWVCFASLSA